MEYPPPSVTETIFNPADYAYLNDSTTGTTSSSGSYLNYPNSQGEQSFPSGLTTAGMLTFTDGAGNLTTLQQSGTEFSISQGTGLTMTIDTPITYFPNDISCNNRIYLEYGGYVSGGSASGSVLNLVADEIDIVATTLLFKCVTH